MRIVEYLHRVDFVYGGPPRAVVDLCRVLHRRGHDVTLATTVTRDVPQQWIDADEGPRILQVPVPALPGRFFRPGQLGELRQAVRAADVMQLHGVWERANIQISGMARRVGTPYVVSLRGMLDDWCMAQRGLKKRMYLGLGGRKVLEGAAFVHCTAEGELEQSRKWFPRGQGRVIPNLMDLEVFETLRGPEPAQKRWPQLKDEGPHLLFLSRLHVKKGIEHLLAAMPRLIDAFPNLQLYMAGPGDDDYVESLKQLACSHGVDGCTHFTGQIGGDEKWSLYEACDLFVLPSSQENFGFVQFEALACGTAVMTTKLVDTWREVVDSGGGIAVEQSADAIVEGIAPLLADRAKLKSMGNAGRQWVFDHMSTDSIASQLEAMYQDAANG
ncbi:MAG: glycosyltransferase [Phycisphaerales bacterium]|nr:glycosyltransferase [Phycisphaerales bacterium]